MVLHYASSPVKKARLSKLPSLILFLAHSSKILARNRTASSVQRNQEPLFIEIKLLFSLLLIFACLICSPVSRQYVEIIMLMIATDFLPLPILGEDSQVYEWLLLQTVCTRTMAPLWTIFMFSLSTTAPQQGSLHTDNRLTREDMNTITLGELR